MAAERDRQQLEHKRMEAAGQIDNGTTKAETLEQLRRKIAAAGMNEQQSAQTIHMPAHRAAQQAHQGDVAGPAVLAVARLLGDPAGALVTTGYPILHGLAGLG